MTRHFEPPLSDWPPADVETLPDKERDAHDRAYVEELDGAMSTADWFALKVLTTFPRTRPVRVTPEEEDE